MAIFAKVIIIEQNILEYSVLFQMFWCEEEFSPFVEYDIKS